MINYKTDDSFFTFITPKLSGHYVNPVRNWFWASSAATNRFIYNEQLTITGANLETIETFYPTIKTIMVAINPWYVWFNEYRQAAVNKTSLFKFDTSKQVTLTEFLRTRLSKDIIRPSQISHARYCKNGDSYQAACIFKAETLAADFKVIQEYFEDDTPLNLPLFTDYRPFYTEEARDLVETVYREDIEWFGYLF